MDDHRKLIAFLDNRFPTISLIAIIAMYVTGLKAGFAQDGALTCAMYAGLGMFTIALLLTLHPKAWDRMTNVIVLWTTLSMAMAAGVCAAYPGNPFLSLALGLVLAIAAGLVAVILERWRIGGQRNAWFVQYGLLPCAILAAASDAQSVHTTRAAVFLFCLWALHFFWKGLWARFDRFIASPG